MGKAIQLEALDKSFCDEVEALPGGENIKNCYACGTCAAGCPVTAVDDEYNCRTIIQQIRLGMRKEVLSSPKLWYCLMCYRCYARCPQKVNFTDVMRALRYLAVKNNFLSEDMAAKSYELETTFQELRKSVIKETIEGNDDVLGRIKKLLHPAKSARVKKNA